MQAQMDGVVTILGPREDIAVNGGEGILGTGKGVVVNRGEV